MRTVVVGVRRPGAEEPALQFATAEALRRGLPLQVVHAESARAEALLAAARASALLVVGRGRSGPLRREVASVSAICVRGAWCPVMVVPESAPRPGRRVLVAVDGSAAALTALSWAAAQAREAGLTLAPVVVVTDDGQAPAGFGHYGLGPDITSVLWHFAAEAGAADLEVHPFVLRGYTSEQLVTLARPDDLLVVGGSGRRPLAGLVAGSTSLAVAELASCPVVVVRAGQARRELHQRAQGTRVPALRDLRH